LPHIGDDAAREPEQGSITLSLRAEIVRFALRWLVKRRSGPKTTVAALRRQEAILGLLVPPPPWGTVVTRDNLGGVKAVSVATKESLADRHVLYLHGGGHVSGKPALYRDFIWRIAAATRARVFIIDHRLAPEHPYPADVDDAVQSYRALLADDADPRRLAVMGESSGGGLTLGMLLRLRDEGTPLPAAAVVMSPWTDLALTGDSLTRNAKADPMIRSEEAPRLANCYLAGTDPRTPYASPLYGDPAGLPPTLIHVGSDEVLLDDSVRMAERMRAAGCQVELEIWPRMPHTWHVWARVLPEAQAAIARIGAFVEGKMAKSP
jgi:monoterpene epsilon-lactone hydrolase